MRHVFKERAFRCDRCQRHVQAFLWDEQVPRPCDCGGLWQPDVVTRLDESSAVHGDEWPGGKVFENGFTQPTRFYSKSEYHQALKDRGLQVKPEYEGHVGHAVTKEAIEQAKEMVSRGSRA